MYWNHAITTLGFSYFTFFLLCSCCCIQSTLALRNVKRKSQEQQQYQQQQHLLQEQDSQRGLEQGDSDENESLEQNMDHGSRQLQFYEPISGVSCYVTNIDAMSLPDQPELPMMLTCTGATLTDPTSHQKIYEYKLKGDTEEFFQSVDITPGHVKLTAPAHAIVGDTIYFNSETIPHMVLEMDHERRRRLQLSGTTGTRKVLIVRVSNDNSSDRRVQQSAFALYQDVFTDENNLKKVYENCSNGKLNFVPSPSFAYGVMQVNAPWNICGQLWIDAYNSLGINLSSYDADHMMVVMPDCVNWNNAAGWGQTPGTITWFPSAHASKPVTQVHEMGHNFGHRHSGKGGISYADDTGYMGNKAVWTDEGSAMCFNAAKTWWFGWFSDYHRTVRLSSSAYSGVLVSPAQSTMVGSNDIVIRIMAEGNGNRDLYVMFNLAAGANAGVVGSRNQIVIIEQSSATAESTWVAGLSGGQTWQKSNWGSGTIVVKNCGINWGTPTTAKLVIAYSTSSALNCNNNVSSPNVMEDNQSIAGQIPEVFDDTKLFTSSQMQSPEVIDSPDTVCVDVPGWFDSDGPTFNCEWYSSMDTALRCRHGNRHPNNGHTAMTACCACGGGEQVEVKQNDCRDEHGWFDSKGKDCTWYESNPHRCARRGHRFPNKGMTANQACCYCKSNR